MDLPPDALLDAIRTRTADAVVRASALGRLVSVVLVDRSGMVVSVVGAPSSEARRLATRRARAAASLRISTEELGARVRGAAALGARSGARCVDPGPGGVPLFWEGRLVGAVGVAGVDAPSDLGVLEEVRSVSRDLPTAAAA
jgi:uncharacterized protein GlcG (DUF336 family)